MTELRNPQKSTRSHFTYKAIIKFEPLHFLVFLLGCPNAENRGALRRRQLRLILGGKLKPMDATELKALFIKE